ncbi:hypothetical protein FQN54_009665 [Arachnomyces sp. PD_36]|nr:hypothetical protein FQN54_009665 [Arachnomyces sp. PD_36]
MLSRLPTFLPLFALSGLLPTVHAACGLSNIIEDGDRGVETREELCKPQGEDAWTFGMQLSQVSVPTFNGGNAYGGVAGSNAFIVYDNYCERLGIYEPEKDDCAIPYEITETWLPWDIIIEQVNYSVGDGDFSFAYAAGDYMIGENGATCEEIGGGLRVEIGCKSAFPVNGE